MRIDIEADIDVEELATSVAEHIDVDEITDEVLNNINLNDLAEEVVDKLRGDALDDLVATVAHQIECNKRLNSPDQTLPPREVVTCKLADVPHNTEVTLDNEAGWGTTRVVFHTGGLVTLAADSVANGRVWVMDPATRRFYHRPANTKAEYDPAKAGKAL